MDATKNMDSVFAACTESELDFDVMFDDDDSIIDSIAGVDEAGNLLTGEDFDWEAFDALGESDDLVGENPDFDYPNDEKGSDFENSKDKPVEIGGEVGDGKEVSGKENSAESQAYDDKKEIDDAIGVNDKQQTALETGDLGTMDNIKDTEAEKLVCPACGKNPCECKNMSENALLDRVLSILDEGDCEVGADSPIDDPCDCATRAGKDNGVDNTEGENQEVLGAAIDGNSDKDPIADDIDDAEARDGKTDPVKDTEGVDQDVVGAALEDTDINDFLLNLVEESEEVDAVEDNAPDEDEATGAPDESCKEDASEGPIEDDDAAERMGDTSDAAVETEACNKESDDTTDDEDDMDKLEESTIDELFNLLEGDDPIADDIDDAEARDGKADPVKDTEGVDQDVVGAALEANDFLDDVIGEADPDEVLVDDKINSDAALVDDKVAQDLENDADIEVAKEAAEDDTLSEEEEDQAIENIDAESDSDEGFDINSGTDDDELIDAIINGDIEDL